MSGKTDRLKRIINVLKVQNGTTIKMLAEMLNVSEMTIRRDINTLAKESIVTIIHGGVIYNPIQPDADDIGVREAPYFLQSEETRSVEEKRRIAKKAASLIEENDTIVIDAGSTTEFIPDYLPTDMPVKIVCFAINILLKIYQRPNIKIIFGGGYYHDNIMMFECAESAQFLSNTRANKAFMSARGVSDKLGITTANHYEIVMKKAIMESSLERILCVDSSKFGKVRSEYYADLEDFQSIITDDGIPGEYSEIIEEMGIKLFMV